MARRSSRSVKRSGRAVREFGTGAALVLALVVTVIGPSCASNPASPGGAAGAEPAAGAASAVAGAANAGSAGKAASAGSAGSGLPAAGAPSGGSASGGSASGGAPAVGGSPAQAGREAGVDHGDLFGPDAGVALAGSGGKGNATGGSPGAGGSGPLGDGNFATARFGGPINGSVTFTQRGTDVTMVVSLTTCAAGSHRLFIAAGDSCDSASTQGNIWDGKRGDGVSGPMLVTCANNVGTMNVTRSGADAATKWTVADHNFATDVTTHPLILSDPADISKSRSCASFF